MTLNEQARQHLAITDDLETRVRLEYAKSPALAAFSHQPIPFNMARDRGLNSYQRAYRTALATLYDEAGEQP